MAELVAEIDWHSRIVRFSGSGTFAAKEEIKALGRARWNNVSKSWEVHNFSHSIEKLQQVFPGILIQELQEVAQPELKKPVVGNLPSSLSVIDLLEAADLAIRKTFPKSLFLRGVISKSTLQTNACFIELRDEANTTHAVQAVIWNDCLAPIQSKLKKIGFSLEEDLNVMFQGDIRFNAKRGAISFIIQDIVPEYTLGKLAQQREITNERLKKEGLFAKNKQLSMAFLPMRLGIITSASGTVINDFKSSLDEACFGFELLWYHARVQGAAALSDMLAGIKRLEQAEVDAILIFRGGGSKAELAIFNEYQLARAICLSTVPVVSAIGHQADESSTQDVSFLALGVPKDVGRYFADRIKEHRQNFKDLLHVVGKIPKEIVQQRQQVLKYVTNQLQQYCQRIVDLNINVFEGIIISLPRLSRRRIADGDLALERIMVIEQFALQRFKQAKRELIIAGNMFIVYAKTLFERMELKLDGLARLLTEQNPERLLERGFVIVRSKANEDKIITRAEQLSLNETVNLQFFDQVRIAKITK